MRLCWTVWNPLKKHNRSEAEETHLMNLQSLNQEQRKAAETLEGPVLILAGAGSGKTRAQNEKPEALRNSGL